MTNQLKTFTGDNRLPIEELYASFLKLEKFGWIREIVHQQKRQGISLPILSLRTKKTGPAVWLIAGIHGEEPAGPVALAQNIEFLARLGEKMPLLLLPLCNPKGYLLDWRYPNKKRDEKKGTSVGDSSHLLADLKSPQLKPRAQKPACLEAKALTSWVIKIARRYPPSLVIDFHEDEDLSLKDSYIFFNGEKGAADPLAKKVVKILLKNGFSLPMQGKTDNGEEIRNGVVANIADSSIDELLSARKIILEGKIQPGPLAEKVVVVETRIMGIPLGKRVKAHQEILRSLCAGGGTCTPEVREDA